MSQNSREKCCASRRRQNLPAPRERAKKDNRAARQAKKRRPGQGAPRFDLRSQVEPGAPFFFWAPAPIFAKNRKNKNFCADSAAGGPLGGRFSRSWARTAACACAPAVQFREKNAPAVRFRARPPRAARGGRTVCCKTVKLLRCWFWVRERAVVFWLRAWAWGFLLDPLWIPIGCLLFSF